MREIEIVGKVRRTEAGTYQDKTGATRVRGSVVLSTEWDKIEISLDGGASAESVAKVKALPVGESVRLLVGVQSGDSYRADPRFVFLDDLTGRK